MAPTAVADILPSQLTSTSKLPEKEEVHVHGMTDKRPLEAISHGDVTLAGIPTFPSFAETRQWQLEHMAAAFRHWSREGFVFGISGHISVRDPEWTNCIWLNPLGKHFGLLNASDMILVNLDNGKVVGGNQSRPPNAAGFLIHAPIHRRRPDAHSVCHAHTKWGKAWSTFGKPLEMLSQDSCKFYNAHACYNQYGGVVLAEEEGERIADALGNGKGAILRNHGLLTVGRTVDEAAFMFLSMEKACEGQILAEAAAANGLKKVLISDEEAEYNFRMESDYETCYAEFQPYYDYEDHHLKGEFKQ